MCQRPDEPERNLVRDEATCRRGRRGEDPSPWRGGTGTARRRSIQAGRHYRLGRLHRKPACLDVCRISIQRSTIVKRLRPSPNFEAGPTSSDPSRIISPLSPRRRPAGAVEDDAGGGSRPVGGGGADLGDAFGMGQPFGPLLSGRGEPGDHRLGQPGLDLAVADPPLAVSPLDLGQLVRRGEQLEQVEQRARSRGSWGPRPACCR